MAHHDYHLHSCFCDGQGELTEWVEAALDRRLAAIGFSSHAPLPFTTGWAMPLARLSEYITQIRALQAQYRGQVEVYLGLEVDYVPGLESFREERILGLPLDYVIGAVHFVGGERDPVAWTVDGPAELFDQGLREEYDGDVQALVEEYYRRLRALLLMDRVTVVGHLDRIQRNNVGERYFRQDAPWYRRQVEETLQAIAARQAIVELNAAGWYTPVALPNPSPSVLRRCRELGVRVTLGSDGHRPEHLARGLDRATELLRRVGYREAWRMEGGVWAPYPLAEGSCS